MSFQPWHPAQWEEADVLAIQAVARGEADSGQQQRALRWIVESASMTYQQSFTPNQSDVTSFIEGRRSVGNQVIKLMKLDLRAITKAKT